MSSSAFLTALPIELLDEVTEELVTLSSSPDEAISSLLSLSQTNRLLRYIACPVLYRVDKERYPLRALAYALEENKFAVLDWLVQMEIMTSPALEPEKAAAELVNSIISFPLHWVRAYGNASLQPHGRITSNLPSHWAPIKGPRKDLARPFFLTPLHIAAKGGNLAACRYLISHGAHVDARGDDPNMLGGDLTRRNVLGPVTPLHLALQNGHDDVALFLLEAGASLVVAEDIWGNEITLLGELVRLRKPGLLRRMLEAGLVSPDAVRTARDFSLGGVAIPLLVIASAAWPDPDIVSLLIDNGADPNEVLPIPAELLRDDSPQALVWASTSIPRVSPDEDSDGRLSWLSRATISPCQSKDSVFTPTPIEAICNGGVKSYIQDKLFSRTVSGYMDETQFMPDSLIEDFYQTLLILLSHGGAEGLLQSSRLHNCLQGLVDNALYIYRSGLDMGRFARAILKAVEPPEFLPLGPGESLEESTKPFLLPYLLQSLATYNFPLFAAISSYISSPERNPPHTQTIQILLPIVANLIPHLAHLSPQAINTLAPISITVSPTWLEAPKTWLWFPGTRVQLPDINPRQPGRHVEHFVHVPAHMPVPAKKIPGPECLAGVQHYNNGVLNGDCVSHDIAPSAASLASLQAVSLVRQFFESYLSCSASGGLCFWEVLELAKQRYDAEPEKCIEEAQSWAWTDNILGLSDDNKRIPFLFLHARSKCLPDPAWRSWSIDDIETLSAPSSSSVASSTSASPFFLPGARFKGRRETAMTETSISELLGTADVPELSHWIKQEQSRRRRGW